MKELKGFIKGLKRLDCESVSLEIEGESKVVELDNLIKEVDNIGIKELGCVFFEEMDFVSKSNENVWIYALV